VRHQRASPARFDHPLPARSSLLLLTSPYIRCIIYNVE
jgi:hypothetical protein